MSILTHTVAPHQSGVTVRELLERQWHISATLRRQLCCRPGALLCNGQAAYLGQRVHIGDVVQADVSDEPGPPPPTGPYPLTLSVLWEDEHLLAIDKPAGVAVHDSALTAEKVTVAGAVLRYLGASVFHAVNRLDRGTSGVMLVAKNAYLHSRCTALLHTDALRREYRAVCCGLPQPPEGRVDAPIARAPASLLRRQVDAAGQPAVTDYRLLHHEKGLSLLALYPHTGRTHQLRLHMAHLGCPLAGDWLYGQEDRSLIPRPALHSYRLRFVHPITAQTVEVTAPLPPDLTALLPLYGQQAAVVY